MRTPSAGTFSPRLTDPHVRHLADAVAGLGLFFLLRVLLGDPVVATYRSQRPMPGGGTLTEVADRDFYASPLGRPADRHRGEHADATADRRHPALLRRTASPAELRAA